MKTSEDFMAFLSEHLSSEDLLLVALYVDVSSQIAARRLELGMSEETLAKKLHISRRKLRKWESGDCNLRLSDLSALSCALDIEIHSPFVRIEGT